MNFLTDIVAFFSDLFCVTPKYTESILPVCACLISYFASKTLSKSSFLGQPISTAVPWHSHKQGTPTMGGIAIIAAFFAVSFFLKPPSPKTIWIYAICFVAFWTGLLDDFHKIYFSDNRGLGKLEKLWMLLSGMGVILFAKCGRWAESAIFTTYILAVIFNRYVKNWFLKKSIALVIAFYWWFSFANDPFIALLMAFLPPECTIISLGMQKNSLDFLHLLMVVGLGSYIDKPYKRSIALSIGLLAAAIYEFLFLGGDFFLPLLVPAICATIIIVSAAAFDILDGLDGLLASVSLTIFTTLAILTQDSLFAIFCGSIAGFLCVNLSPALIFMGDCGSLALGSLFGASIIGLWMGDFSAKLTFFQALYTGFLLSIVPFIDLASVAFNISMAKLKLPRFFFAPIHHDLEKRLGERTTVFLLWLVTFAFCILGAQKFISYLLL